MRPMASIETNRGYWRLWGGMAVLGAILFVAGMGHARAQAAPVPNSIESMTVRPFDGRNWEKGRAHYRAPDA